MPKRKEQQPLSSGPFLLDPAVNLFRKRLTDDSIVSEDYVELRPTTTLKKGQPICFDVVGSSDLFLDPQMYVKLSFKVAKPDGTSIGSDNPIAPINNFLHSLWNQVEVTMSGKEISPSSGNYMYLAYFHNQFLEPASRKQDQLQTELFF